MHDDDRGVVREVPTSDRAAQEERSGSRPITLVRERMQPRPNELPTERYPAVVPPVDWNMDEPPPLADAPTRVGVVAITRLALRSDRPPPMPAAHAGREPEPATSTRRTERALVAIGATAVRITPRDRTGRARVTLADAAGMTAVALALLVLVLVVVLGA